MDGYYVTTSTKITRGQEKTFKFLTRVVQTRRNCYTVGIVPVPGSIEDAVNESQRKENTNQCLLINICPSEDGFIGCIIQFAYDKFCSLSPGMDNSEGRFMIKPTLEFCREIFGVTKFNFIDSSSFTCNPSGQKISMGDHNILVYGETWYERIFGATPEDEDKQRELRMSKLILSEKVNKEHASKLVKFVRNTATRVHLFLDDGIVEEFSHILLSSVGTTSWNGMFHRVNDMANKRGCEFFTETMVRYVFGLLKIFGVTMWEIEIGSKPDQHLESFEKIQV